MEFIIQPHKDASGEEFLSVQQMAGILDIHPSKLYQALKDKNIPKHYFTMRKYLEDAPLRGYFPLETAQKVIDLFEKFLKENPKDSKRSSSFVTSAFIYIFEEIELENFAPKEESVIFSPESYEMRDAIKKIVKEVLQENK